MQATVSLNYNQVLKNMDHFKNNGLIIFRNKKVPGCARGRV